MGKGQALIDAAPWSTCVPVRTWIQSVKSRLSKSILSAQRTG